MPQLVIATSNVHKVQEVVAMLGEGWQVQGLRDHPGVTLPEETGATFAENAILKALGASAALPGLLVLADDSGLEVDVLNGAPGVWSARYAGEGATDAQNRAKLKENLHTQTVYPGQTFAARFRCCLALVRDGDVLHVTHGTVEGHLLLHEKGEGGFGYDSLFVPRGASETFGVLPAEVKNQFSHRARALAEMRAWMLEKGIV